MYFRTETRWSYWSRGEASFLIHLSWMKTGSWTMLGYGGGLRLLSCIVIRRILGSGVLRFKMHTSTLPLSFLWVVCLATSPAFGIGFFLSNFALLGIFFFLFFKFFTVLDHMALSLQ